jgi:hypothetical protein
MKEREVLEGEGKRCQGCGKEEEGKMARCKGCEAVWYCNKVGSYQIEGRMRILMSDRNVRQKGGVREVIKASVKY